MTGTNRRQFIQGGALAAAGATAARGYEKPGHFTVDCQSHFFVPELVAMMAKRSEPPYSYRREGQTYVVTGLAGQDSWHRRLRDKHMDVDAKLADMDEAGISLTTISTNDPGPETFGAEGPAAARVINDWIADLGKRYPERFAGLIVLPLQDMNASLKELDRCANQLSMKGVLLYSNLDGRFPDEPEYAELFAEAERMDLPVLLHPAHPVTYEQTRGRGMMAGLGLMFDTTIALGRIILAGILDKHPKLKLVCPHVGGTLPYLIGRIDHQTQVLGRGAENIVKPPSEYLRSVYLDAVSPIPMAIQYGIDYVGIDRMLYASDHPWVDPKTIAGHIQSLGLESGDQEKIFGGNARKLFKL